MRIRSGLCLAAQCLLLSLAPFGLSPAIGKPPLIPQDDLVEIAAGRAHSCAVTTAGGVRCWGDNDNGQLGDNTIVDRPLAVDVSGLASGVVAVEVGDQHSCALTAAGAVRCWGASGQYQTGAPDTLDRLTSIAVPGAASDIDAIAIGGRHGCALTDTGAVKCWGANTSGELGDGTTVSRGTAMNVLGLPADIVAIAAGDLHSCAVDGAGDVHCWGQNSMGQLGDGTTTSRATVAKVDGLAGVVAIAAGDYHTCARTDAGTLHCWGSNANGQFGTRDQAVYAQPIVVASLAGALAFDGGIGHTCVQSANGGVRCIGGNDLGQLGDGTAMTRTMPVDVVGVTGASRVAAGDYHGCAIVAGSQARCWGNNLEGQLGDGSIAGSAVPVAVRGLRSGTQRVATGSRHSCAITDAGGVRCWGMNTDGQLGDGTQVTRLSPVAVVGLSSGVTAVAVGLRHSCALLASGGVQCWGSNGNSQLGNGNVAFATSPVDVESLQSGVTAIAAGGSFSCALLTDGTVRCWGSNFEGQLGDGGTSVQRFAPAPVVGLGGVTALHLGSEFACALVDGGTVQCWGYNGFGQLGDDSTTNRNVPGPVVGLPSGVTALAVGFYHACVLAPAGPHCWGANNSSQLGDDTFTHRDTPVAVVGAPAGIHAIAAGATQTCALPSGGAPVCWGDNMYGQLGDGTRTSRRPPTPVVGGLLLAQISAGADLTCGVTLAGATHCWGFDLSGQLGDGGRDYAVSGFVMKRDPDHVFESTFED